MAGSFLWYKKNQYLDRKVDFDRGTKSQSELTGFLLEVAAQSAESVLQQIDSSFSGLSYRAVRQRRQTEGLNQIVSEKSIRWWQRLIDNLKEPLGVLMLVLIAVAYGTGDTRAGIMITVMMVLSVVLRLIQETKADRTAQRLRAMVHTTVTVRRQGDIKKIPLNQLVRGDIVQLSAGNMVPADLRLIESKDLFVNQSTLTGETMPVEKHAPALAESPANPLELNNICYLGTNVETGTAQAVVIAIGNQTYLGRMTQSIARKRPLTSFEKGVNSFTWLMIRFILVLAPLVFVINGLTKDDWLAAFMFALAVAVGLTPELLPMIMTVNLAKGAIDLSNKKVIVKRLNAVQNFGAMDVLCTDKTGTLTEGKVSLIKFVDVAGKTSTTVLRYAYLNSFYQTGLNNLLDAAVLKHSQSILDGWEKEYKKIDELPFDFIRRRMSVVVADRQGRHWLICKGAVEEVLSQASKIRIDERDIPVAQSDTAARQNLINQFNAEGFRVIAVAIKKLPITKQVYTTAEEKGLVFLGLLAFLDPPKSSAAAAISQLVRYGVQVKVLTGDNELVTRKICHDVGFKVERILLGQEVDSMSETELELAVEQANVFDKLEPHHKEKVIMTLQRRGHVVGFLGDGINDAPALHAADVGISVDTAVDIAKESSDIILLEKSLEVLQDGVRGGRKIFANIIKYIKMSASSNFGNMFSCVGASLFLPFLPMLPVQIIANNLLYDFSQITIPTDNVDEEYLVKPRHWDVKDIRRFIIHLGPVSSIFDYLTFFLLLVVFNSWFNPAFFQTGWFVVSLLTQTVIIHIIRTNQIPFLQSRARWWLIVSTLLIIIVAVWLPFSPLASALGFVPLPLSYWFFVAGLLLMYLVVTQLVKTWFVKKYGT